jgi:hypothetical protein
VSGFKKKKMSGPIVETILFNIQSLKKDAETIASRIWMLEEMMKNIILEDTQHLTVDISSVKIPNASEFINFYFIFSYFYLVIIILPP